MDARFGSVRVVVVGTGFGCITHVRALRQAGMEVVALVGRDEARTRARAERHRIPLAVTDMSAALDAGVDAVTIATPPHTHAELVMAALETGKHVVCEKPLARDAAEARRLRDAARSAGVVALVGCEFRWSPAQALLARAVEDGLIGAPRLALFTLLVPILADPAAEVPDWWARSDAGGGWLGAHASHVVDQIRDTLGDFEAVSASLPRVGHQDWTAEDSYVVHFRLRSGAAGVMISSASDRGPISIEQRIIGTGGTAWVAGDKVMVSDAAGTRTLELPPGLTVPPPEPPPADLLHTTYDLMHSTGMDLGPYVRLYETFGALASGAETSGFPRPPTFEDGVAVMEVFDAIRASAVEGRQIRL